MKGLLIKDLKLTLLNIRIFIIIIGIAVFMLSQSGSSTAETASFVISYITIIFGMFVLSSISYDDFEHGLSFLLTLPVTRKLYVLEKYVFGLLSSLTGWLLSLLLCLSLYLFKNSGSILSEVLAVSLISYLLLVLMLAVTIPVQLKFGGSNGKIVIFIVIGACYALGMAGTRILKGLGLTSKELLVPLTQLNTGILIILGSVLAALALICSFLISCKIMNHKQL